MEFQKCRCILKVRVDIVIVIWENTRSRDEQLMFYPDDLLKLMIYNLCKQPRKAQPSVLKKYIDHW